MTTPVATLGGVQIPYGVAWELKFGVAPVQRQFKMPTERAEKIFNRGRTQIAGNNPKRTRSREEALNSGPIEYSVTAEGYKPLVIKGLYVTEIQPIDDTHSAVLVVDSRWLLARKLVGKVYNERRTTGENRLVQDKVTPAQVNREQPDYAYKRVTMDNGVRWSARRVLEDVLRGLVGSNFEIRNLPLQAPVEHLFLEDDGDKALAKVLTYLPGSGVFLDKAGKYVVKSTLDYSEEPIIKKIRGSTKWWGDDVRKIDKALLRPSSFVNFFDEEVEMRFDYTELADATVTRTRQIPGRETRDIENVLPVVHPAVTFNGKEYARGSWLQVDQWITATQAQLAADGDASSEAAFALSHDLFRRHIIRGFEIPLMKLAAFNAGVQIPIYSQIFNTVATHWRRTFRILPQYMDKLRSIRAVRAAILDQETGTRARAEVFANYVVRPTIHGLIKRRNQTTKAGYNFTSYAALLANATVSPVNVNVVDPQVGIFTLAFALDPWGEGQNILPGALATAGGEGGEIPSWDMSTTQGLVGEYVTWESPLVFLSGAYSVAVVLTVSRASPNDTSRYHAEEVTPAEAASLLPGVDSVGLCLGPPWAMKSGPAIDTARYAWIDAKSGEIDSAMWDGLALDEALLINPVHLRNVAKAQASRIYAMLLDRNEGTLTLSMDADLEPTGAIDSVIHSLSATGVVSTRLTLPPLQAPLDIWALMPDSTRKLLQRQIQE